jgi:hypothetical protein
MASLFACDLDGNFYFSKPDDPDVPDGLFKATACKELGIDDLFVDFEADNPSMLADYFSAAQKTVPFTSWGYSPE